MRVKKENEVGPAAPDSTTTRPRPRQVAVPNFAFLLRLSFTILKDKVNLIKISQLFSSLGLV